MSTYLVAFIVSDFKYEEQIVTSSLPSTYRVYAQPKFVNQTSYALSEGVSILSAIAKYVNVEFPLSKMDQVAIPDEYFAVGGLVLYLFFLYFNWPF